MSQLTLYSDELSTIYPNADGFAIDANAEENLCKLLDFQEAVNQFVEEVKEKLAENALKLDKDFVGLTGDKVKLEYRPFGSEFNVVLPNDTEETYLTRTERVGVNVKAVRDFMETHNGELPYGIEQRERKKTLVIKRKGER